MSKNEEAFAKKEQELSRILYTVSHDFRGPLTTIKGYAGMLREHLANGDIENATRMLDGIEQGAQSMGDFLSAALKISRLNTRPLVLSKHSFQALMNDVLLDLADLRKEMGAEISVIGGEHLIEADAEMLVAAMKELVQNALEHTEWSSGPLIKAVCARQDGHMRICVTDAGVGVDTSDVDRLFRLFERGSWVSQGQGIGLALVAKVAELHKGKAGLISAGANQGVEAWFTIEQPLKSTI